MLFQYDAMADRWGEGRLTTIDCRGTENRDQVLDKVLALLNKRKTRTDVDSVPLFVCQDTVAGRQRLGSLVTWGHLVSQLSWFS